MISIDRNLCTGCGICVDSCPTEAISLTDSAAVIDGALCTSCGRCLDVCLTGAIIRGDDGSARPAAGALAGYPETQPSGATAPALPAVMEERTVPVRAATMTRLEFAERALSGLLTLIAYALDLKQRRALTVPAATSSARRDFTTGPGSGAGVRARARSLASGVGGNHVTRHMGGGQGARGGRRMGPGGGRGSRHGWNNGCGTP